MRIFTEWLIIRTILQLFHDIEVVSTQIYAGMRICAQLDVGFWFWSSLPLGFDFLPLCVYHSCNNSWNSGGVSIGANAIAWFKQLENSSCTHGQTYRWRWCTYNVIDLRPHTNKLEPIWLCWLSICNFFLCSCQLCCHIWCSWGLSVNFSGWPSRR